LRALVMVMVMVMMMMVMMYDQIESQTSGYGMKKITLFGSFALLVNNLTGAGMCICRT
jgi:hypothetical protein